MDTVRQEDRTGSDLVGPCAQQAAPPQALFTLPELKVPAWVGGLGGRPPAAIALLSFFFRTSPDAGPASALKSWLLLGLPPARLIFTFAIQASGT